MLRLTYSTATELSAEMYEDGIKDITNIDISEPVIEQMKQRYGNEGNVLKTDMRCTSLAHCQSFQ